MLKSITPISRRSLAGILFLTGTFWLVAYPAAATALTISSARWSTHRNSVSVNASGQARTAVSLTNAYDSSQVLGSGAFSRDGTWYTRINRPEPVPCRVRAESAGQSAEMDVQGAPSDCAPKGAAPVNLPPTANTNGPYNGTVGSQVAFNSSGSDDTDGTIVSYAWDFGDGDLGAGASANHTYANAGNYVVSLTVTDDSGDAAKDSTTANIAEITTCPPEVTPPQVSINSTSQESVCQNTNAVSEQSTLVDGSYRLLAINDLGMHCGDLDTRIAGILPPFQVLLAQVIRKGGEPDLNPAGVSLYYSAASNTNDPILSENLFPGLKGDGSTFKTNFWDAVAAGTYDPFYPGGLGITPLEIGAFPTTADVGLPVPNVEELYIGADGVVDQDCDANPGNCDGTLTAVQHAMPGLASPYVINTPREVKERYGDKPFFVNFPFGYVAEDVNWHEGAGIPFAAFDDFGRENAYPLVRVQATIDGNPPDGNNVLATVDTVLPISGEASCTNCHADPADVQNSRSSAPTDALRNATPGLPVAVSLDDPDPSMPPKVSVEYAADINILRLHDLKHGPRYVSTACDAPGQNCLDTAPAPCDIHANGGDGDTTCLTNKALVQGEPVVCQLCHYTPALDLGQVGPKAGAPGTGANGRNQIAHQSNSRVMHNHHGQFADLFPDIPAPIQDPTTGAITNQGSPDTEGSRLWALENSCYQCHPGKNTKCLRGAMFNGDMLCSDCHGDMLQVGADFSAGVSPENPGAFVLHPDGNFYDPGDPQPRVPWANEPGCGSCHTGDSNDNAITSGQVDTSPGGDGIANIKDTYGNTDGIRLRQAFRVGDGKATPIVPTNKRFAEPSVPASFNGFANPGAGNPRLYRISTGHGGVMCEGCHGATHAEWPNANPNANDNVTANQIQGHTGTISECSACHTTSQLPSNTQGGPHGMHLVNDRRFWKEGHKDAAKQQNGRPGGGTCGACHGSDHRGTVLARAPVERSFTVESRVRRVEAGEPVACDLCHSLSKSFGH
ncbi:MAG: PKD domain-containing protein [Chromatiaceae bacterium]|nr:PKD domain-containing protein [Chromatiaceae bacterium]